jgi:hypothetical protein
MKDQLIQLLKRPPRADAVATMQAVQEFKKFYAAATKKLAKSMTETELASLYQQSLRWY